MGAAAYLYQDSSSTVPAVSLEYRDQAAEGKQLRSTAAAAEEAAGPPEQWCEPPLPPLPDIGDDAVHAMSTSWKLGTAT